MFVGVDDGDERLDVDTATGAVVVVNVHDGSLWHINASVMAFGARGCDPEEFD